MLYRSRDGLDWEWITEFRLPSNTWNASETTLRFMPDEELVALVREHADTEETTIIVTADDEEITEDASFDGEVRTLEKPYSGDTLLQSLLHTGKYSVTH